MRGSADGRAVGRIVASVAGGRSTSNKGRN